MSRKSAENIHISLKYDQNNGSSWYYLAEFFLEK